MQEYNDADRPDQEPEYISNVGKLIEYIQQAFIVNSTGQRPDEIRFNGKIVDTSMSMRESREYLERHILSTPGDLTIEVEVVYYDGEGSYCDVSFNDDIPLTNVKIYVDCYAIGVKFGKKNIRFPEQCLPTGMRVFSLCGYHITNASKLPFKDIYSLSLINCDVDSLSGLNAELGNFYATDCRGITTLAGMKLSECQTISLGYVEDTQCELKNFNGFPADLHTFIINAVEKTGSNLYVDLSEDHERNNMISSNGITYKYDLFKQINNCKTSFTNFFISIPAKYEGPLLQFLLLDVHNLAFEFSAKNVNVSNACMIVYSYSGRKPNTTNLLNCQEQLIETGLAQYAKL